MNKGKKVKLIPDDIRDIIEKELPSYWLREVSNKINDYVGFGGVFDIGITPNNEVHCILQFNPNKVKPTPKMKEYLKSVYEKAIELNESLYSKPQLIGGSGHYNDYRTLSAKPRVWNKLVTQEHKEKVFNPKNYEVTLYENFHLRDRKDVYNQIFGKVTFMDWNGNVIGG
jgi:hypothetical protein